LVGFEDFTYKKGEEAIAVILLQFLGYCSVAEYFLNDLHELAFYLDECRILAFYIK
jgi:hypothetical protein